MGACQSKTTTTLHHPPKDTIPQTKKAASSSLQQQPSLPQQQQQSLKSNYNNGAATTEASSALASSSSSSSRGAASRASRNAMTKASSSSTTATAESSPEPESAPSTTSTSVVSSSKVATTLAENNKALDIASDNEESAENVAPASGGNESLASPRGSVRTSSSSPRRRSTRVSVILPSTLSGPPIAALVPPGVCQISDEAVALPLLQKFPVTANSAVLRFGLPNPNQPLNLTTCACLLAQAKLEVDVEDMDADKKDEEERKSTTKKTTTKELVTRPYTPISTNEDVGYFDVLIKDYGKYGKMSRHLHSLATGETVLFKHIPFNVKLGAEEFLDCSEILMLAGGTGFMPMLQALHAILGQTSKRGFPKVTLLYGSRTSKDILGRQLLDQWSAQYPNQLKVHHVLSQEPMTMSAWDSMGQFFLRGRIDRELIEHSFGPCRDCVSSSKTQANKLPPPQQRVLVCGPPALYQALCGPRDEPQKVRGALAELGYTPRHVYKF